MWSRLELIDATIAEPRRDPYHLYGTHRGEFEVDDAGEVPVLVDEDVALVEVVEGEDEGSLARGRGEELGEEGSEGGEGGELEEGVVAAEEGVGLVAHAEVVVVEGVVEEGFCGVVGCRLGENGSIRQLVMIMVKGDFYQHTPWVHPWEWNVDSKKMSDRREDGSSEKGGLDRSTSRSRSEGEELVPDRALLSPVLDTDSIYEPHRGGVVSNSWRASLLLPRTRPGDIHDPEEAIVDEQSRM